jgi:hypothetical protein
MITLTAAIGPLADLSLRLPRYECFLLGQERIGLAKAKNVRAARCGSSIKFHLPKLFDAIVNKGMHPVR